jgi:hypothetical protein
MKYCSKCKLLLLETQFTKHDSTSTRLQNWCRLCKKEIDRQNHFKKALLTLGITKQKYDNTLERQNNSCAICRNPSPSKNSKWSWMKDHDHNTGKFRGLLCINCNVKLGWYERYSGSIEAYLK